MDTNRSDGSRDATTWPLPARIGPFTLCVTKGGARKEALITSNIINHKLLDCTSCWIRPSRSGYTLVASVGYCERAIAGGGGGARVMLNGSCRRMELLVDAEGADVHQKRALRACSAIIRGALVKGQPLCAHLCSQLKGSKGGPGFSGFAEKAVEHLRMNVPGLPEPYSSALSVFKCK
jgi:hypothetical protein